MIPSPAIKTGQTSTPITIPAPIGGLNGRDPLAAMDATDAYYMDNFFPGTRGVISRNGCEKLTTVPLAGPVQSLEVYSGGAGDVLLAWAGAKIYTIADNGIASEIANTQLSNLVITTMFSNSADNSQHLIIANGFDVPKNFNGALTNLVITGMVGLSSTLNFVFAFKGRLYWGQRDKLGFYYLPVGQIQGALTYYDLAQVSRLGGYLVAIASFSQGASGETPADYIVFITSKGEMIVYGGYDPSSIANWGLVGRYYAAPPIGNKCTINYGSELLIITTDGVLPFSEIKRSGDARARGVAGSEFSAITSKLGNFLSDYNANKDVPGWQGLQYAGHTGWLLVNVPATGAISGKYFHYIMNTTTNAWTRFIDWNGLCFTVYKNNLYFGRYDGHVLHADRGKNDDEETIRLDCKQAYNYFDDGNGMALVQKHFQWASVLLSCDGMPPLSGKFNVDFKEDQPDYISILSGGSGAEWDTSLWDVGLWGSEGDTQRFIVTLNKGGSAGSLWLRASLEGLTLEWYATQFVMERTKGLLI